MMRRVAVAVAALVVVWRSSGERDVADVAVERKLYEDLEAHPSRRELVEAQEAILADLEATGAEGGPRYLPVNWRHCPAAPPRPYVVWVRLDAANMTRNFLVREAAAAASPRLLTTLEFMVDVAPADARAPAGLVFQMPRSGSTLALRMLHELRPPVAIYSEAALLQSALDGTPGDAKALELARSVYAHYGRAVGERRIFLKLWITTGRGVRRALDAFAATPAVFLHRDPRDVLASCLANMPAWLRQDDVRRRGRLRQDDGRSLDERAALAADYVGSSVRAAVDGGARGLLAVPYDRVVEAFAGGRAASHLGLRVTPAQAAAMRETARWDAKDPTALFEPRAPDAAVDAAVNAPAAALGTADACASQAPDDDGDRPYCALLALQRRQDEGAMEGAQRPEL